MVADMTDRVCVVTGANTGIGRVTATELAAAGAHVILACRSRAKAEPVAASIRAETGSDRVELVDLDLGSLTAVRSAAAVLLDLNLPIHVLLNNAGLVPKRGGVTSDGFELAFGTNHLGHFLWTQLLADRIRDSAPARIVNVASHAHYKADPIDWDALRRPTSAMTGYPEYCVSKLANVLFSAELHRRMEGSGVSTYAVHPGVVASDIWRRIPRPFRWFATMRMISNEEGARTSLHCATDPGAQDQSGLYWDKSKPRDPSALARDESMAAELWQRSEQWCEVSSATA